jgi:hypothetical protein
MVPASPTIPQITPSGTVAPTASPAPTIVVVPRPPRERTNEDIWRAQQARREVFEQPRAYVARAPVPLWWYDPLTGQSLEIGTLFGEFVAQAEFVFQPRDTPALEVPYRIDQDFGLTAISPAVRERMAAAGYTESVEAYVLQSDAVQPLGG